MEGAPPIAFEDRSAYKARMRELLELDPARTVVVTVDMQRQYLDLGLPGSPVPADEAERVLSSSKRVLDALRERGIPVIHAYVQRRPVESQRGLDVSQSKRLKEARQGLLPSDRMAGSPQAEVPAFLVAPEDVHVTTKKSMDCFLDTELDVLLRRVFNADAVILMGINTDTCVFSTAFSTSNRGYKPIVVEDCVASNRGKDQHWMALELMSRSFAWVLTADELLERLGAGTRELVSSIPSPAGGKG